VKGDVSNWPEVLNVVKDNEVDTIFPDFDTFLGFMSLSVCNVWV
jgi:hypothetical protein